MTTRLTLRSLIAHYCGMLDGATSRMVAQKVKEIPHVQRIKERIDRVLSRTILHAGSYDQLSRHYVDPNFAAAYLSNDLHGAMLLRFEQHCLRWDPAIEETAACNLILASVFADPPSDPQKHAALRQRLYALGAGTTACEPGKSRVTPDIESMQDNSMQDEAISNENSTPE